MLYRPFAPFLLLISIVLSGCGSPAVLNTLSSDSGFVLTENVPYDATADLALDIYRPPRIVNAPVVVFFYGGRWSSGDKSEYKFVGQALASRGFVAVLPNVRKYPAVRFPAFVQDGARALRWTRDNIATYGGDPQRLFVMGHSSGAHIAAMLALDGQYLQQVGGSRDWLRGMIGLSGPYDFMPITAPDLRDLFGPIDRFRQSQPIFFVDGLNPPLLLMTGRDDEIVPAKNTLSLAAAVSRAGGPVETVIYDKLSHEMIVGSLASYLRGRADVLDHIEGFVVEHANASPQRPETEIQAIPLAPDNVEGIQTQPLQPAGDDPASAAESGDPGWASDAEPTPPPLQVETLPPIDGAQ
ncbi:MAG: alpha/beta hydrolase [Nevskiales bacterium]|nr:alpha/beta hydrolase [Nevskiales bacterium]